MLSENEGKVLELIKANPFLSQREIADQIHLTRSTVATIISSLVTKKQLLGRAYVVNQKADVYCVGAMNVDRKFTLMDNLVEKTSNPVTSTMSTGGVARNVAENLGRLGQQVSLISVAGFDQDYEWLKQQTSPYVDLQNVTQLEGAATSAYSAVLDPQGEMQVAIADMTICDRMNLSWIRRYESLMMQARLLVMDLNSPLETVDYVIKLARRHGVDLVIVPVSSPKMKHLPANLHGVKWLIVNQDESEAFFNTKVESEEATLKLVDQWLDTGVEHVMLTRGGNSSYYGNRTGVRQSFIPAKVDYVGDVTGAGDAYVAGIIYGILQGESDETAIELGMTNAHQTIKTHWTVNPDLTENYLRENYQLLKEKGAL